MIRTGLIWSAVLIGVMIAMALYVQVDISEATQVPIHWNAQGEVDGYATPSEAMLIFWILIGTAIFTSGLLAALLLTPGLQEELAKFRGLYLGIWLGTVGVFVAIALILGWVLIEAVNGGTDEPSGQIFLIFTRGVLAFSAMLFMILGNYMPKTRQNGVVGIRTPWSLASTDNWERTHRMAGPMMMGAGLVALLSSIFLPLLLSGVVFTAAILIGSLVPVFYSYRISQSK
jgi:uncharacterized membrane protein